MRATVVFLALIALAFPRLAVAQQPTMERFRACSAIEDMTKERLDCFDAIVRPEPRPGAIAPTAIADCRFIKEEDARLRCFNSFMAAPGVARRPAPAITAPQIPIERFRPCHTMDEMTKERLDCFDALVPPAPPPQFTAQPRSIFECRYFREQDDRLRCYVNFTARLFKAAVAAAPAVPRVQLPHASKTTHARKGRGGCGSRGGAGYRTASGKCASRKH